MINISEKDGAVTVTVRVVPRASSSGIIGPMNGAVKVRVASPPVDGAANAELIKLLARTLGVPESYVEIVSGHSSKTKQIRVSGLTAEQLEAVLTEHLRPRPA